MKTAVFAVFLLLAATVAGELTRFKRLTAFGKSPSNPSPPPLVGKGRECKADKDCDVIPYTSCRTDPRDSRKRCICKDGTPPSNGQCPNRPRALREACNIDHECLEGAECKINPNATTISAQRQKVCLCRDGRIETGNACSGSEKGAESGSVLIAFGIISLLLAARPN